MRYRRFIELFAAGAFLFMLSYCAQPERMPDCDERTLSAEEMERCKSMQRQVWPKPEPGFMRK